jgi:plastocyanin
MAVGNASILPDIPDVGSEKAPPVRGCSIEHTSADAGNVTVEAVYQGGLVMRALMVAAGGVLLLATAARGLPAFDLAGTTRVGERAEPNAVVWLESTAAPARETPRVALDQRNLSFSPHVLAVHVGTTVEFPNRDRVFHNVFSFHDGKRFDLGMYPVGTVRYVTFGNPGLSRIFCNIHPNMAAYVMAVDSWYFAAPDASGRFVIAAVPQGTYVYHAWHPGGATLTGSTTVDGGTPLEIRWP